MKSRFCFVLLIVSAVMFGSCMMLEQMQARQYTFKPDGVNNNMVYGYMDLTEMASYGLLYVKLLPMEYELLVEKTGLFGNKTKTVVQPKLPRSEENALLTRGTGVLYKNVFGVENLDPGEYYMAAIVHYYSRGNTSYEITYQLDKPEKGDGIQVGADEMIYWGARKVMFDENDEGSFEVSDAVTRKDVAAILAEIISNKGWDDRLASEM